MAPETTLPRACAWPALCARGESALSDPGRVLSHGGLCAARGLHEARLPLRALCGPFLSVSFALPPGFPQSRGLRCEEQKPAQMPRGAGLS